MTGSLLSQPYVLIFVLIIDMELSNVADILHRSIRSDIGVTIFIIISVVYLVGQYVLLRYSKLVTLDLRTKRKDIRFIDLLVFTVQIIVIILFLIVIVEITLGGSYDLIILLIVLIASNGLTAAVMMFLFNRLLRYYKSHPDSGVLSYSISGLIISVTALVTILFMGSVILSKPDFVSAETPVYFPTIAPGSVLATLNYSFYILSVISFISVWVGTMILLRHYSVKLGKLKFWVAMCLPLAFYLSQILVVTLQLPLPFVNSDSISYTFYYRVIFTVSSTIGGLLFAQPFFIVSKLIVKNSNMRRHLIVLGLGMVLFFVSGSATVYHAPFPPFGLPTVAVIGFSSYLLFLGLYSAAISLSEDSELYKLIRTSANDWKFFLKLSDSEVENDILSKVDSVTAVMTRETGITPSVSEADIKDYLMEVLSEVKNEQEKK